ncbi:FmdB family zinc ribbon protein [Desulfocurvus sp. DL9XJH121]
MPMYEYECTKCGLRFEELAGCDDPCPPCPQCSGAADKVVSAASIRTEYASPIDRGVAPMVGYNPTGRKPACPMAGGCGSCGGGDD